MTSPIIPARLHADEKHPLAHLLQIRLDGALQSNVIAYDMHAGWVEKYVTDKHGSFVIDRRREEAERVRLTGDVTVSVI